jgi:hypothetical protein
MKFKGLIPAILLAAIGLIPLAAARPSLSQTKPTNVSQPNLNLQLQQALCAQNWGQALQILDRMKSAAGPEYASQIVMYRGRIEALARENAQVPGLTQKCAVPSQSTPEPANNNVPPTPEPNSVPPTPEPNSMPPTPESNPMPPALPNSNGIPPAPDNNNLPTLPSNGL